MRPALLALTVGFFCFVVLALVPSAQQQTPTGAVYQNRCASCHGTAMTGATGPSILGYVRYHTDADIRAALIQKHKSITVPEQELRQILADIRQLAGTNPSMATGGYTGRRAGGPGLAPSPASAPVGGAGRGG